MRSLTTQAHTLICLKHWFSFCICHHTAKGFQLQNDDGITFLWEEALCSWVAHTSIQVQGFCQDLTPTPVYNFNEQLKYSRSNVWIEQFWSCRAVSKATWGKNKIDPPPPPRFPVKVRMCHYSRENKWRCQRQIYILCKSNGQYITFFQRLF